MLRKDKVIIGQLIGGLGNQMFQYVFYKYLSSVKNIELELDLSGFGTHSLHNGYELNSLFGIEENIASLTRIAKYKSKSSLFFKIENKFLSKNVFFGRNQFKENNFRIDKKIFAKHITDLYVEGYFQTYKYISYIEQTRGRLFSFSSTLSSVEENLLEENCVAIHIRGGDYILNPKDKYLFGDICTRKYYQNAIGYIKSRVKNPKFLLFTNDFAYAKDLLNSEDFQIVDWNIGKQSFRDMYLMSLCKHNIIANSSFSWWRAWLNQNSKKIIIALVSGLMILELSKIIYALNHG